MVSFLAVGVPLTKRISTGSSIGSCGAYVSLIRYMNYVRLYQLKILPLHGHINSEKCRETDRQINKDVAIAVLEFKPAEYNIILVRYSYPLSYWRAGQALNFY